MYLLVNLGFFSVLHIKYNCVLYREECNEVLFEVSGLIADIL
jgi:hypothetical protein